MKKKKKTTTSAAVTSPEKTLKTSIKTHSEFFDALIDLIPPRFYLPNDDDDENTPWFQGLSRAAKSAAKKQSRVNLQKSRRERHDPGFTASTLDKLRENINKNTEIGDDVEDTDEGAKGDDVSGVTYEGLREKLQRRIDVLRGNRGGEGTSRKRKMENQRVRDLSHGKKGEGEKRKMENQRSKPDVSHIEEAAKDVEFGKVKLVEDEDENSKKRRKLSKGKMLEKAKELEEAKRDPEKGADVARKHSINAALGRAAGAKIHDNPTRIKRTMTKEKKNKEKNAEKWKERVASQEKLKSEKQQKRAGNIAERSQQAKMRKVAKREKKLMRPGFEGRKEGYLNQ